MSAETLQHPVPKAIAAALLAAALCAPWAGAHASSHREAPFIATQPQVDGTDFYMFNSYEPGRSGYVTLIANYLPLQDAYGGPNYFHLDPNALYGIGWSINEKGVKNTTSLIFMGVMYLLALGIYLGARWYRKRREGIDLGLIYKEIPVE